MNWYVLLYDYVANVEELRTPFREKHLELVNRHASKGEITQAGAWKNPVDGAAFIFKCADRTIPESFVQADPYVENGIVTALKIKEWTVVAGSTVEK